MQKSQRLTKFIIVMLLVLISLSFSQPASGQNEDSNRRRREVPGLDVIILVDESETMWNKTDPDGIRVNTVNYFIDMLSSEQSGATHRLAIIAFGTEPQVIPYVPLDSQAAAESLKAQYAAVHTGIAAHKDTEYTDINKALQAALKLLVQEQKPAQKPALILISDGQPTNPQVKEEKGRETVLAYLNETRNLLAQLEKFQYLGPVCPSPRGAPLYTVGMGVNRLVESSTPEFITLYREFWQDSSVLAGGYYKEADQLQEMQGISTYIFSELLCTPATPSLGVRGAQSLEYRVYDSYYQIFFTISGKENPEVTAKIHRPKADGTAGGVVVEEEEAEVTRQRGPDYEVWGVTYSEPWAGTWQVVLEGEGRAEFSYVIFPNAAIKLYEPNSGFLPVDKPFTIRAGLTDENGRLLEVPVSDFRVAIEGEGLRKQVSLKKEGDTYAAQLEALRETGEYSLTFNTTLPDGSPLYEHKWVTLIPAPWAEVTTPNRASIYRPAEKIPLQVDVHLAGAVSFEDVKLTATLQQNDQTVQSIELQRGRTTSQIDEAVIRYEGEFQAAPEIGDYDIQTNLVTILPGGRVFDYETASLPISILPPPTPTSSPSPTLTAVPTETPTPAFSGLAVPSPTPTPTPTPTPEPWPATITGSGCLPGVLLFLVLLLLLGLGGVFWRRRHRTAPEQVKLLATLVQSRQEQQEPPYILILGSGPSLLLGSRSMEQVVKKVSGSRDPEKFYQMLDSLSPMERYVILQKQFEQIEPSSGYRRLADLIRSGFFDTIFTTGIDPFLEKALAEDSQNGVKLEVLICGQTADQETLDIPDRPQPPGVKLIKLHGDVSARRFAVTPSEIAEFGRESEQILRHYMNSDLLIVGHGPRDYDISRAIGQEGGSIWYIGQSIPATDSALFRAMRARGPQINLIDGEVGTFDRFFEALFRALKR